ncbi:hypothetical protein [Amycolatopsis sp. CA-126428]|uniref:hypothetical protein n=1 Tax=Amycolatopsis sp. CA-126428 TaxID=2073158 RepID=UPI001E51849A|nr:hypothetical protein [Amycolatopsis sp. CA-126428]
MVLSVSRCATVTRLNVVGVRTNWLVSRMRICVPSALTRSALRQLKFEAFSGIASCMAVPQAAIHLVSVVPEDADPAAHATAVNAARLTPILLPHGFNSCSQFVTV